MVRRFCGRQDKLPGRAIKARLQSRQSERSDIDLLKRIRNHKRGSVRRDRPTVANVRRC